MDPSIYPIPGFAEPVCSLSHLVAAGVFTTLSPALVKRARGEPVRVAALGTFAFCCILLLSMSGVYHLLSPGTDGRAVLRRLDHAAIFSLIAATFTAGHVVLFRGVWRWAMVTLIWVIAATGITLKSIFFATLPEWAGLIAYLGMGWLGVLSAIKVGLSHGWPTVRLLVFGGVAYSIGAVFEFARRPVLVPGVVGPHEVFHVAVIVGIGLHWLFLYQTADHAHPDGEASPARAT